MDPDVRCPQKAGKLNHSLTLSILMGFKGTLMGISDWKCKLFY